ncbi:MAG: CHAD domain-containing protein [Verrucomicrobia bacterium]|nr:CHAD domain-containing protein [Verrucomicrobiota bacterium]
MPFRFEHDETPIDGVKRIAAERLDKAIAVAKMPRPVAEDIHEIRKDLKSLRALLQVMRGHLVRTVRDQENLIFRDAGRILSKRRDVEVLLETLAKLYGTPEKPKGQAARSAGRTVIQRIRQELEADAHRSLSNSDLHKIATWLSDVRARTETWDIRNGTNGAAEEYMFVGAGLEHTYRRGRQQVKIVDTIGIENATDELWHEIRKRAKALGYQLRLLRKVWPSAVHALVAALDELTQNLGDDHDLALVRQRIVQLPFQSSDTEKMVGVRQALLRVIDRRRRRLKAAALYQARMIYVEKPARFVDRFDRYWQFWKAGISESKPVSKSGGTGDNRAPRDHAPKLDGAHTNARHGPAPKIEKVLGEQLASLPVTRAE